MLKLVLHVGPMTLLPEFGAFLPAGWTCLPQWERMHLVLFNCTETFLMCFSVSFAGRNCLWTGKLVQCVKLLATKPDNLHLIPENQMVE